MNIGLLTTSISKQSGGLMWAVRSLALNLSQMNCQVQIISGTDSDTVSDLKHWKDLNVTHLERKGIPAFGYMPALKKTLYPSELDLLHVHGLWLYQSLAALSWYRKKIGPLMISPHGMLDPWALNNSLWKKRLAGWLYENSHLRAADCLHALSISEYESMRKYGLKNPVAVISNGINLPLETLVRPTPSWSKDIPSGSKILLFLSRIHPKKGLVNLLHGWACVSQQKMNIIDPWHLVIAGWDQSEHLLELKSLAKALSIGSNVHFIGAQFDENKDMVLRSADAFILPSFSEGLPVSVLEAWSFHLPVLMTPQCNLPEGFNAMAALKFNPDIKSIAATLLQLFNLKDSERIAMGQRGYKLVEECFTWQKISAQFFSVYSWLMGHSSQPNCVISE